MKIMSNKALFENQKSKLNSIINYLKLPNFIGNKNKCLFPCDL